MKTAKITKRVLRILRVAGTVLILAAFVLFLYAVINTNSLWSKTTDKGERAYKTKAWDDFSADMAAYEVGSPFMRLDFDGRYFSALSAAASKSVELKENGEAATINMETLPYDKWTKVNDSTVVIHGKSVFGRKRVQSKQKNSRVYR